MDLPNVVESVKKIFSPLTSNVERKQCYELVEAYKESNFNLNDLQYLCSADKDATVVVFGLNCLLDRVKRKYTELSLEEKQSVRQCICLFVSNLQSLNFKASESNSIYLNITAIIVHLIKCEWPQQWPTMVSELLSLGGAGAIQSLVIFDVFRRLSEDVLFFQDVPIQRRRELCSVLAEHVPTITHFALDFICSAVKLQLEQGVIMVDENTTRSLRSALLLLSAFYEWFSLAPLFQWKAPEFPPESTPVIQLLFALLRLPQLRSDAANFLVTIIFKKCTTIAGVGKTSDNHRPYTYLFQFDSQSPLKQLLEISQSAFTTTEFSEDVCLFMSRWSEVISQIGIQVIENWAAFESKGQVALEAFDILIEANILATAHPSRLFIRQAAGFFKALLGVAVSNPNFVTLLAKHMDQLLPLWMESAVLKKFPPIGGPVTPWIHATCEKSDYSKFLNKIRVDVKQDCLQAAVSLWPREVLSYLLDWHKRLLGETPKPEDFVIAGHPYIKPDADLVHQWNGLSFAVRILNNGSTSTLTDATPGGTAAKEALLAYLRESFAAEGTDLPEDPGIRQYHLCVLHCLVIACSQGSEEFARQLLSMDFATLRYNPQVLRDAPTNGIAAVDPPPPEVLKYLNLRSSAVKDLHLSVGLNVFRLVRAKTAAMLPYFNGFCSELNDIWTNRHGGLGEQCLLLEVIIYLALRLPCSFEEQRTKLQDILGGILSEWTKPEGYLVAFGGDVAKSDASPSAGDSGARVVIEHFGLNRDLEELKCDADFVAQRVVTRLQVSSVSSATVAILRRLNAPPSPEQLDNVSIPLVQSLFGPAFNMLRTLNTLWQPATAKLCHASMRGVLEITKTEKANQANIRVKDEAKDGGPMALVTVAHTDMAAVYAKKLQEFLSRFYDEELYICSTLLSITAGQIYGGVPTEQLGRMLSEHICPPQLETAPTFRLLQVMRNLLIPYIRLCPAANIDSALVPLMPYVLDAFYQRVNNDWSVIKLVDQDEVNEEEALEEIFNEVTLRSLSVSLVDATRILLTFQGAPARTKIDTEVEADPAGGEVEMESAAQHGDSAGESTIPANVLALGSLHFGPVARSLLLTEGSAAGEMFVRLASWLTAAIVWPDSKTCDKAASLLVKVIDFTLRRDTPNAQLPLPAELASQLLMGGLQALRANGQFIQEVGTSLLNLIGRTLTLIEWGAESATVYLAPILLSALTSCQGDVPESQHVENIRLLIEDTKKPLTEKALRDRIKALLEPIIGIPIAQQYKQALSISTLEPLSLKSLSSNRRRSQRGHGTDPECEGERRKELAIQALADLFGVE